MVLLLTNQVVGWAGLIAGAYFAKKTGNKKYLLTGTVLYIISWGMVFAGLYLAGPEGLELAKKIFKRYTYEALAAVSAAGTIAAAYYFLRVKGKK